MQVTVPVSVGEAIDKLTILDIKCRKIRNAADSKREYDMLADVLGPAVLETYAYHYRLLRMVNEEIWDMQDEIRAMPSPDGQKCIDILNKNDMRFRIKDAVNKLSESVLREQKGYPPKRALFIGHLGLGDHIGLNGAVRYLALQYDEVFVVVMYSNAAAVKAMFADMPSIKFVAVTGGYIKPPSSTTAGECLEYNPSDFAAVYRCGFYAYPRNGMDELPHCFYRDMGMDPSIRHLYFNVPRNGSAYELYRPLEGRTYIFTQQKSSDGFTPLITWDRDAVLTIDPNVNPYEPGHTWYDLAQQFVNKPFMDYILVLENASELHTVDSSFYCITCYLKPKATVKKCYARFTGVLIPEYKFI